MKSAVVFFIALAFCAIFFWLTGFDFDKRSPDVAFGFAFSVAVSLGVAGAFRDMTK